MSASLPGALLQLSDTDGNPFGTIRFLPFDADERKPDVVRGDCIFDIAGRVDRDEVRWLYKRRFEVWGDHRFTFKDGVLSISQGDFRVKFEEIDGETRTRPPAPVVFGTWAT